MIYDIIGDIHGQAGKLLGLLDALGYHHDGKSHVAPSGHKAVFIGDFIDRGRSELQTLQIVFDMLDHGQALAIMGNHEYNAIAYATLGGDGNYLRAHTDHNTAQHQAFLDEVPFGSELHQYWIRRFYELPLWLCLDEAVFVHACYDKNSMAFLAPLLTDGCLNEQALIATAKKGTPEFFAIERLLKGPEVKLPEGMTMTDKTGIVRTWARVKWWVADWQQKPISQALFADNLPDQQLSHLTEDLLHFAASSDKPIFIGHYWLGGVPAILSHQVVCVDYSAGKGGYLTAYQFDTAHPRLDSANFIQFIDK